MATVALNKKERNYLLACIGLTIITAIFQFYTELNVVASFLFIAIVLLTILISAGLYTYIFAILATIDVIIGFYNSYLTAEPGKASNLIYNRLSAVFSIWVAAVLIIQFKKSRAEEEHSNQQINALFLYSTEGIIITDSDGAIAMVNPEAEKQFGYKSDELVGKPIEILLPERYSHMHLEQRQNFYADPVTKGKGKPMELSALRKDGSEFPAEIAMSNFSTAEGMYIISFILDTTELIKQRELAKALEKEMELNELKSRFLSMASHEFRTPLSTILSSVALVEKYNDPTQKDDRIRHINRIRSTVKNLTNILSDFMSLDKLEAGLVRVNSAEFRLDKFCAQVVEEIRVVAKPGQQINYLYAATIRDVNLDQNLLRNILNNLLNNAIKYSPEKNHIDFSISNTANELVISVRDKGMGIPEEDKPFMFDRFFRAKNASNIQGTGLGLNIVKRYVDLMGGEISFDSKVNEGTVFTVKFPIKAKVAA